MSAETLAARKFAAVHKTYRTAVYFVDKEHMEGHDLSDFDLYEIRPLAAHEQEQQDAQRCDGSGWLCDHADFFQHAHKPVETPPEARERVRQEFPNCKECPGCPACKKEQDAARGRHEREREERIDAALACSECGGTGRVLNCWRRGVAHPIECYMPCPNGCKGGAK